MNILGASLQPPLVSGTNIQSVNNTSLLQSGNRNIIKGLHILLKQEQFIGWVFK